MKLHLPASETLPSSRHSKRSCFVGSVLANRHDAGKLCAHRCLKSRLLCCLCLQACNYGVMWLLQMHACLHAQCGFEGSKQRQAARLALAKIHYPTSGFAKCAAQHVCLLYWFDCKKLSVLTCAKPHPKHSAAVADQLKLLLRK